MELERPGQELAIYLSLRERSRPSARVRAHASSSMRAPSPAARGLTTTSPEGRGKCYVSSPLCRLRSIAVPQLNASAKTM